MGAPPGEHPILTELARFHAGFATLEACLNHLLAFALGSKQEVFAILSRIRNIADRIEIIKAVTAEAEHLTKSQKYSVNLACKDARALNARRNVYAHGTYEHRNGKFGFRHTPSALAKRNLSS